MIYICATYDYELFLGGSSYTEKEVLIDQTDTLLNLYASMNIPATYFVDAWSLLKYREYGFTTFPDLADEQMRNMLSNGNDVQLHIHPQWVNAIYNDGKWKFKKNEYSIGNFSYNVAEGELERDKVIKDGIHYLEEVLRKIYPEYRIVAYRAGGYCLEPFDENIDLLIKNGIAIDSSVVSGLYRDDFPIHYDYRKYTSNKGFYLKKGMYELPIGSIRSITQKLWYRMMYPIYVNYNTKGYCITSENTNKQKRITKYGKKIKNLFDTSKGYMLTFDERRWDGMLYLIDEVLKETDYRIEDEFLTIVGHPKVLNERLVENTSMFLTEVKKKYGDNLQFITLTDVWKMKCKK